MKNFETLYKILMNEDMDTMEDQELKSVEQDLLNMDTDEVNPRVAKINKILKQSPSLVQSEAEKIVDSGLYDVFMSQFDTPYGGEDEPVIVPPPIEPEDELPTDDDFPDIPAYGEQERQDRDEEEY